MKERVVFDDWAYRPESSIKQRKADYLLCFIPIWILTLVSIIGLFFSIASLAFLVLALCANVMLLFEYLKVRNCHLVITEEAFYMTNRWNKTKKYAWHYKDCSLEIRRSLRRGGGIWLRFYDKNGALVLKYEDLFNSLTMYGGKLLAFGEAIKSLQIPIRDKNNLFDLW